MKTIFTPVFYTHEKTKIECVRIKLYLRENEKQQDKWYLKKETEKKHLSLKKKIQLMIHNPNSITRSAPPPDPPNRRIFVDSSVDQKNKAFYILARGTNKAWEYIYINKSKTHI